MPRELKLTPDPEKATAIKTMPRPTGRAGVRSLLGFAGYLRNVNRGLASQMGHLTNLLKKDVKLDWTDECERERQFLTNALCNAPVCALPELARPSVPYTSPIGAVRMRTTRAVLTADKLHGVGAVKASPSVMMSAQTSELSNGMCLSTP